MCLFCKIARISVRSLKTMHNLYSLIVPDFVECEEEYVIYYYYYYYHCYIAQ